jgi:hypothetical protein
MIAILNSSYPGHMFKQVVQAFTSKDLPKRPESIKELSSIGYADDSGSHAIFMFDVPDTQVGEFLANQNKRTAFITARAPGFNAIVHVGKKVGDAITELMPMYP